MADALHGISAEQHRELRAMLTRLARLWSELTAAAAQQDQARAETIQREIADCRARVEAIKRAGTKGSA